MLKLSMKSEITLRKWTAIQVMASFFLISLSFAQPIDGCEAIREGILAYKNGATQFSNTAVTLQNSTLLLRELKTASLEFPNTMVIGEYVCSRPIVLDSDGLKLIGIGDVRLKLADNSNSPLIIIGPTKTLTEREISRMSNVEWNAFHTHQIHVENLKIDGNRKNQQTECWLSSVCDSHAFPTSHIRNNGVTIRYSYYSTLKNIYVTGARSGGLVIEKYSSNLLVDGFTADDSEFDGFAGYQTQYSVFQNMKFTKNVMAGISIDLDFRKNSFYNVDIIDTGRVGIFGRATSHNYFKNINIIRPHQHGVFLAMPEYYGAWDPTVDPAPRESASFNTFEDLRVEASATGAGVRINNAECIDNKLVRPELIENSQGAISLGEGAEIL